MVYNCKILLTLYILGLDGNELTSTLLFLLLLVSEVISCDIFEGVAAFKTSCAGASKTVGSLLELATD